jgi:Ni/Fe-hydrogenase subunit HybB-like protein
MELTVSLGLVALGFAAFALAVRYLPIFPEPARAPGRGRAVDERTEIAAGVEP